MFNAVIAGNIGRDAETRQAGSGTVTNWSVAVEQRGRGGEKTTTWVRCALWGKRGETLAQYLTKGSRVAVSGELTVGMYDGKPQVELNASDVTLMGGKPEGGERQERGGDRGGYGDKARQAPPADDYDDIPF